MMLESSRPSTTTIVSCPGKVLISGGYLLLDRAYSGIVVGTCSRFYSIVKRLDPQPNPSADFIHQQDPSRGVQQDATRSTNGSKSKAKSLRVIVRSPQFIQAEWSYLVHLARPSDLVITPIKSPSSSQNKFVEFAIRESLKLSLSLQTIDQFFLDPSEDSNDHDQEAQSNVTISILGDNDFYSQPRQEAETIKPFNCLNTTLKEVHKTGLGSSAAMVTSLCSAILLHFTPSLDTRSKKLTNSLLHNLSQFVHSLAQGKVGSGFDVSAALWGTHVYRRFSPSCLDGLLDSNDPNQISPDQIRQVLDPRVNKTWTDPSTAPIIERFSLPKFTTLLLADVDAGSHTPSMVGQVLKWRNRESQLATQIWTELSSKNDELNTAFKKLEALSNSDEQNYLAQVLKLSNDSDFHLQNDSTAITDKDDVKTLFIKVSSIMKSIRKLMKEMGNQSDVPIEPDSQTNLLDQCEKLGGVIGSGVPGAGGYDAIWLLVFTPLSSTPSNGCPSKPKSIEAVLKFLNEWPACSVRALSPDSWVIGGSRNPNCHNKKTSIQASQDGLDDGDGYCLEGDDGIQVFESLEAVEGLKTQLDLFS